MNHLQFTINNRNYFALSSLANEYELQPTKNYLFELPYLATITVQGENASDFLQGQLSCDVREVDKTHMRRGAQCNLKGRVQSLVDVINWHGLELVLPDDLIHDTLNSLAKTALVSRVNLQANYRYQIYGFYLANTADLLPALPLPPSPYAVSSNDNSCCYHIGNHCYIVLIDKDKAPAFIHPFAQKHQLRGSFGWHRLQLLQKQFEIYPETRGLFLTHRINLHQNHYINFEKGCYKGQEIIARTHYLGKQKHGLEVFIIHSKETLHSGKRITNTESNVDLGELIDFCPMGDDHYLILSSLLHEHPQEVRFEGEDTTIMLMPVNAM